MNLIVINERGWVAALQAHEDPDTQMAQGILLAALGGSESMEIALFVHNAILHLVGRHDLVNSRGQLPQVRHSQDAGRAGTSLHHPLSASRRHPVTNEEASDPDRGYALLQRVQRAPAHRSVSPPIRGGPHERLGKVMRDNGWTVMLFEDGFQGRDPKTCFSCAGDALAILSTTNRIKER